MDEPYSYSDGTPINEWDGEYWGSMTIRRALAWSRNIPALKTFQVVGKEKAAGFAEQLGIELEEPIPEAAAIGGLSTGVTPLQMAGAYAAFGNEGVYHTPYAVKKIVFQNGKEKKPEHEPVQAMHDYTAYMITNMLKTAITSGTGTGANIPSIPVAGKTGSTNIPEPLRQEYHIGDGLLDSWFTGYTTQYTAAVWTGYPKLKDGDDVHYIRYDGSEDIAKEIFQVLMENLSDSETPDFKRPDSVGESGGTLYVRGAQPTISGSVDDEQQEDDHTDQKEFEPPVQQEEENEQEPNREEQEQKKPRNQNQHKEPKDQQVEEQKKQQNEEQQDQNEQKNQDPEENKTDQTDEDSQEQDKDSQEQDNQESNPDEGEDQDNGSDGNTEDQDNSEKGNKDGDNGENSGGEEKDKEDNQSRPDDTG